MDMGGRAGARTASPIQEEPRDQQHGNPEDTWVRSQEVVGYMETERDKCKNQRRQAQRGVVPSPP